MSSDFFINLDELKAAGLVESMEAYREEYTHFQTGKVMHVDEGTQIKLRGYEYARACAVFQSNAPLDLAISCSGRFRTWLGTYLKANNITFEMA